MSKLNEILMKIAEVLKTDFKTEKLIGEEFKFGEFSCMPIFSVSMGSTEMQPKKSGKENKKAEDEATIFPVGFLVSRKESIFFVPAITMKGLRTEIEKIPDVIEKFRNISRKKKETA